MVTLLLHVIYKMVMYFKIHYFITYVVNKIYLLYNIVFFIYTER